MPSALRHVSVRAAIALLGASLVTVPGTVAASASTGAACSWDLQVVPVPAGYTDFYATGARDRYSVGAGFGPDGLKAMFWDRSTVTVLDAPNGHQAIAMDVNNHGVVVANDVDSDLPFISNRGRTVKLVRPTGAVSASVTAINDAGTIVGSAMINDRQHGIVWSTQSPRKYQDLGAGEGRLSLSDVNESGTIVATTRPSDSDLATALRGTASQGFSPIPGVDKTKDSAANSIAGGYVIGAGTRPGDDDPSSIRWNGDTATAMPSEFGGLGVNSAGLVGGSVISEAAVWDGETVTRLPSYLPGGFSAAYAVTENGTAFGLSQATDDSNEGAIPVRWTCS